jgi:hypothetical protein
MIRRRRRPREIPFSFDSFLDIVANVVGIIIRLILVVWVGARSYSSVVQGIQPASATKALIAKADPDDPVARELAAHRQELARAQERLLAQLRQFQDVERTQAETRSRLQLAAAQEEKLTQARLLLEDKDRDGQRTIQQAALSSSELRERSQKLAEEIRTLESAPQPTKTLHYRTPVSRPLQLEELLFECNAGRVTFVDIGAMLQAANQSFADKKDALRTQWAIHDITPTVGAFRLRYTFERERGVIEGFGGDTPNPSSSFRYGMTAWTVEAISLDRGETLRQALVPGSEFRQVVDGLDPKQSAVTFWVYPDSFELFRRLRDYLYERDIVVAGRPLPAGVPIASSRRGTVSRGQ